MSIVAKHDIKGMQTNILISISIQSQNPVKSYIIVEKKLSLVILVILSIKKHLPKAFLRLFKINFL